MFEVKHDNTADLPQEWTINGCKWKGKMRCMWLLNAVVQKNGTHRGSCHPHDSTIQSTSCERSWSVDHVYCSNRNLDYMQTLSTLKNHLLDKECCIVFCTNIIYDWTGTQVARMNRPFDEPVGQKCSQHLSSMWGYVRRWDAGVS